MVTRGARANPSAVRLSACRLLRRLTSILLRLFPRNLFADFNFWSPNLRFLHFLFV